VVQTTLAQLGRQRLEEPHAHDVGDLLAHRL
jgi:hypothetical protein